MTSKNVLTIGPHINEKGGISQVIKTYSSFFSPFHIISTSKKGNTCLKVIFLTFAIIKCATILTFNPNIKIVHIHTASDNSFKRKTIFIAIAKFFRKKIILHIHGGNFKNFYSTNPKRISYILQKADLIIALSNGWKQFFISNCHCKNVTVLNNPIEKPHDIKCQPHKKTTILFLGKVSKEKGIYDLIEVVNVLIKENKLNISLQICGNDDNNILSKLINKYNLKNDVEVEGWVEGFKKSSLLANADIFILPSYIEGLPICILEAMSYKKPIITTPVGGIPEIITHDKNGILVPPGDKNALAKAIITLYSDPDKCQLIGNAGYETSKAFWSDNIKKELFKIYETLLNNDTL